MGAQNADRSVFLGSTFVDLVGERAALYEALRREFSVIRMEDFGSDPDPPLQVCLDGVERADAYVLLLGGRYGAIARDAQISYTHAEYEHARKLGRPVFAYVRNGFETLVDSSDEEESKREMLKDFRDDLENAHVVRRPYFDSPETLVKQVLGDLRRWRDLGARRPTFGRIRRRIREPQQYARGVVGQSLLQLHPYRVALVDLAALNARDYPSTAGRRLTQKLRSVHDDLAESRVNVMIFNELPVDNLALGSVLDQRLAQVKPNVELIVCAAHGNADIGNVDQFADVTAKVALWYPDRLSEPSEGLRWFSPFTPEQLQACSVTIDMLSYIYRQVDAHLVHSA